MKNDLGFLGWVGLLLLMLLVVAGCKQQGHTWDRIEREGILRVGMDPSFPPFEEFAFDSVQGIDADLARALSAELNLEPQFVFLGYDGLYDGLKTGRYDVLISGIVPEQRRTADFAYSEPYFNAGQVLVVREGLDFGRIDQLPASATLAVELGADGHVIATQQQKKQPDLTILPLETANDALRAVQTGDADAAVVDSTSARIFLSHNAGLTITDAAVSVEPFALVVRIADRELLRQLDDALAQIEASGTLNQIIDTWISR
jgi:polar amino acid transport system substrate-binding protein